MVRHLGSATLALLGLLPCLAASAQDVPARQPPPAPWPDGFAALPAGAARATLSTRAVAIRFANPVSEAPTRPAAPLLRFAMPAPTLPQGDTSDPLAGGRRADFAVGLADAGPGRPTGRRPAPTHDEGLASGNLDLGARLSWDFENGLNYAFSDHLTGLLGYGSLSEDDDDSGPDLGLDGPVVGLTFQF